MTKEDIVATTFNMAWQDVAAEKRRIQAEAIAKFPASDGTTESEEIDASANSPKSVNDGEILRKIASAEISCDVLTACRIRK